MEYEILGEFNYELFKSDPSTRGYAYESITEDGLRTIHAEDMEADAAMCGSFGEKALLEMQKCGEWHPASTDFDEWLKDCINRGRIRIAE